LDHWSEARPRASLQSFRSDGVELGLTPRLSRRQRRGSRAVLERSGLTYVRTFPTSRSGSVEGADEGEVEYELTREQWERRATELPR